MRYLDRKAVAEPSCLTHYRPGTDTWEALSTNSDDYRELREQLNELQHGKCAYCESELSSFATNPHVDHFRKRSQSPELTFRWDNLFCSCTTETHCGRYKDKQKDLEQALLLKPDEDDPRVFLHFSIDGSVSPKLRLDDNMKRRAQETIRAFNLDSPKLRGARRSYLCVVENEWRMMEEMNLCGSDLDEYLGQLRQEHADRPFSTAILSLLE